VTRDELLAKLRALQQDGDTEGAHIDADDALLAYINDPDITEAYRVIDKWYA